MTPLKDLGECLIGVGGKEFLFRPSFINMTRIGEPDEIVQAFHALFNDEVSRMLTCAEELYSFIPEHQRLFYAYYSGNATIPQWAIKAANSAAYIQKTILTAINVLQACCDDDVSELTGWSEPGKTGKRTFVWRRGYLPPENMILIAQSLMMHGVIGRAKVRKLQRDEGKDTTAEFHATEYIMAARNHFGISREEAENLTMTEFAMMINAKYPDRKGFTREEFDAVIDEDDRRWQELIEREKAAKK